MSKICVVDGVRNEKIYKHELSKIEGHCTNTEYESVHNGLMRRVKIYMCKHLLESDLPRCGADKEQRPCTELREYKEVTTWFLKRKKKKLIPCNYYANGRIIEEYVIPR